MERIRSRGHAVCDEESEIGAATVAVPVVLPDGTVRSALGAIGPRDRIVSIADEGMVEDMQRTAGGDRRARAGDDRRLAGAGALAGAGRTALRSRSRASVSTASCSAWSCSWTLFSSRSATSSGRSSSSIELLLDLAQFGSEEALGEAAGEEGDEGDPDQEDQEETICPPIVVG